MVGAVSRRRWRGVVGRPGANARAPYQSPRGPPQHELLQTVLSIGNRYWTIERRARQHRRYALYVGECPVTPHVVEDLPKRTAVAGRSVLKARDGSRVMSQRDDGSPSFLPSSTRIIWRRVPLPS